MDRIRNKLTEFIESDLGLRTMVVILAFMTVFMIYEVKSNMTSYIEVSNFVLQDISRLW